jgi:hypothetical protein
MGLRTGMSHREIKNFTIRVEANLSHEERFYRTKCLTRILKNGKIIPTVDLVHTPVQQITQCYTKEIYLVRIGLYLLTWQVLGDLYKSGFVPICFEELAAFSEQYPDQHFLHPTVMLYETTTGRGTYGYAAHCLHGSVGQRTMTSIACGDGWGENCRFAVSKRIELI